MQPTCGVCGRPGCVVVPGSEPEERSGVVVRPVVVPGLPAPLPIVVLPGSPACPPGGDAVELRALISLLWAHVDRVDLPPDTSTRVWRALNGA